MKFTATTDNPQEALRLAKADDMAYFIWELVNNGWRKFKHSDYDYHKAWDHIHEMLEEHNINPEELWS